MSKKEPSHIIVIDRKKSTPGGVNQKMDLIITLLKELKLMDAATQAALDKLNAAVAEDTNVTNAVVVLLQGMAAQIAELKKGTTDPAVIAALDAAAEIVASNTKKAADAVVANTPSA